MSGGVIARKEQRRRSTRSTEFRHCEEDSDTAEAQRRQCQNRTKQSPATFTALEFSLQHRAS
jgi:hypothetical protein